MYIENTAVLILDSSSCRSAGNLNRLGGGVKSFLQLSVTKDRCR